MHSSLGCIESIRTTRTGNRAKPETSFENQRPQSQDLGYAWFISHGIWFALASLIGLLLNRSL